MRVGTLVLLLASAVLFLVVRQFLLNWGLVERRHGERATRPTKDFGLARLYTWGIYFVLWICPSWLGWAVLALLRDMRCFA